MLSKSSAFYLLISISLFFLAGSSAPTPLYALYQAAWGFSPITVTVVFGIYAVAVLLALLVVGSLSDFVGRRPVLLVATSLQIAAMLIFASAQGVGALLAARVVQGLSTGAAAAAVGAGMLDLDRERGTIANAVAPMFGTATGGILSGLMLQYLPAPTLLVYLLLAAVFAVQLVGIVLMPESATPRPGALGSLRPRFVLPPRVRPSMWVALPALVAAWSLAGFYLSLGPSLIRRVAGSGSLLLAGFAILVLAGSGAIAVLAARARTPRETIVLGTAALVAGLGITLLATASSSIALFLFGSAVAGAGFGMSFQGAIRSVLPLAAAHERAGVLSILYVVAYLAMGLPAVVAGVLVVHGGGLLATAHEYTIAVMAFASVALTGALWRPAVQLAPAPVRETRTQTLSRFRALARARRESPVPERRTPHDGSLRASTPP